MPYKCGVFLCENIQSRAAGIRFFRFPKAEDEQIRNIWIERCHQSVLWDPDKCGICSEHFTDDDYERDLQAELLGLARLPKLKKDAVPTLHLGDHVPKVEPNHCQKTTSEEELTELLVPEILLGSPTAEENFKLHSNDEVTQLNRLCADLKKKLLASKTEIRALKSQLQTAWADSEKKCMTIKSLRTELRALKTKKVPGHILQSKIQDSLQGCFTNLQVITLLTKRKRANWGTEEMSVALTLRYLSKRAYIYLRYKLHYPLPGISSLQRWASKLEVRSGLLHDVLKLMKIAAQGKASYERVVVLCFDEVKVTKTLEYDQKADEVVGPHTYMQVVMARGLFSKWKQPVYTAFDQKMTPEILHEIISKLNASGYVVRAMVSDMGGGNQGLWKSLGINNEQTWFESPGNEKKKIFYLPDTPHLLKLFRNWLLDTDFRMSSSKVVSAEPLKELLKMDSGESRVCHQLTAAHLDCQGHKRRNVRMAATLLSHRTAAALRRFKPGPDPEMAAELADVIDTVNDWFDVMNSFTPKRTGVHTKCPYGMYQKEQDVCLQKMYDLVKSMRCCGKKGPQVFQTAIMVSIKSVQALLKDLRDDPDMKTKYLLTHRLNQDCLESFFSQLRTLGGLYDHPSPLNALFRLRMIILGKNPGMVQEDANNVSPVCEEYMSAEVLRKCGVQVEFEEEELDDYPDEVADSEAGIAASSLRLDDCKEVPSEMEDAVLEYVAGWVAHKHKNKHPDLGSHTYQLNHAVHTYSLPSWLHQLSFGGVIQPSDTFHASVLEWNAAFLQHNGTRDLKRGRGLVNELVDSLCMKHPSYNRKIIKTFVRVRTFIRLRFLRLQIKSEANLKSKNRKRSATSDESAEASKTKKKMTKISL